MSRFRIAVHLINKETFVDLFSVRYFAELLDVFVTGSYF